MKKFICMMAVMAVFSTISQAQEISGNFSGGSVKIGQDLAACDSSRAGAVRYNTADKIVEVCNGTGWVLLGLPAACNDRTPTAFSFTNQNNVSASTLAMSTVVQLSGFGCEIPLTISGAGNPAFRVCGDSSCSTVVTDWSTTAQSIIQGQYVQLRLTSNPLGSTRNDATLVAGGMTAPNWEVTTTASCVGSPPAGTVCADGTVYVGVSPDGSAPMYTTRCDAPQTWAGSSCSGIRQLYFWNNGSNPGTATGFNNTVTGKSNSAGISAMTDSGAIYQAARYCEDLVINGQSDWYLPALVELNMLYANRDAIGNFDSSGGRYLSSTENQTTWAWRQRFSDGNQLNAFAKSQSDFLRCVRR